MTIEFYIIELKNFRKLVIIESKKADELKFIRQSRMSWLIQQEKIIKNRKSIQRISKKVMLDEAFIHKIINRDMA